MRYIKILLSTIIIVVFSISLSGCLVAAVGAGIAAVKYGNAKKQEAMAKESQSYNQYALGMQQVNMERQEKGMKPEPIMTIEEYNGQMGSKN